MYDVHARMSMSGKLTATTLPSYLKFGRMSQISSRLSSTTGPLMLP